MHGKDIPDNVIAESPEQQAFIDERATASKRQKKNSATPHSIPENTPVPDEMDVEPFPFENVDIMDEDTIDDLLHSPREGKSNPSSPSTSTAKELRAFMHRLLNVISPRIPPYSREIHSHSYPE